ncbi:uncharacterized protein LOC128260054 [Drosophila gunungcola]|uniref:uncharacterized protein LOC128258723 n=1 Tax=Drosophila gunungcola TaxID=103775 RepID=UPI0022E1D52B|nr:uncharacterized protein LOC128258723 [Drosophila gunungcola]XP_052848712.1 uncharacterized protein LOC128260054 [Drosophila gunungcola]
MEAINFNDFTPKERYEIIKDFLVKMRRSDSMPSKDLHVQRFFDHYLRKFYKLPKKLVNDIAYCQRAMKTHLAIHQTIVSVFGTQADADPVIKNNYINELEEMLYEMNAECNYLVLRLQDDIDRFCLAFTEQDLKPNELVIREIVSEAIVPLIIDPEISIRPQFVMERPTESQLLKKYFIIDGIEPGVDVQTPAIEPPKPPPPSNTNPEVKKSRLNLQAALKRARSNTKPTEKNQEEEHPQHSKDFFMQSVGLCTHLEHERQKLSMVLHQKRKPKPTEKTK